MAKKKITPRNRTIAFMKTDFCCSYCGSKFKDDLWDACLDHVIPESRGGSNKHENLIPACRSCNASKSTKTLDEYRLVCWARNEFPDANLTLNQIQTLLNLGALVCQTEYASHAFYFEGNQND